MAAAKEEERVIMEQPARKLKSSITNSMIVLCTIMAIVGTLFCAGSFARAAEGDNLNQVPDVNNSSVHNNADASTSGEHVKYGLIAAAIAFGLGAIGAGIAISHVGAAAMGAVAEKPEIAGQALIFVALAEGLVVFGFITALMILGKV